MSIYGKRGWIIRLKWFHYRHPFLSMWVWAVLLGAAILIFAYGVELFDPNVRAADPVEDAGLLSAVFMVYVFLCPFFIYPFLLSIRNVVTMLLLPQTKRDKKVTRLYDGITIGLGVCYSFLYESIVDQYIMKAQWWQRLWGTQLHQPVWTESWVTIAVLSLAGVFGYLLLTFVPLHKLPPLLTVFGIAGMYLGTAQCILWCIQVSANDIGLCVFPANCILIAVRTIRVKMQEWREMQEEEGRLEDSREGQEGACRNRSGWYRVLYNATYWPLLAFLLMWPLLGVLLAWLVLFGQRPDAVIKAWTETADWRLSAQTAPPNVQIDEHYLCTVAAGGHKRVVKPIRMGKRHGHLVVVNRQLCIANAFEQILEERMPGLHRIVRRFYDTYGFPVARLIRTKIAADVVYILMKPLEWMFLTVIYLCDTKPENRIAVQYLPRK